MLFTSTFFRCWSLGNGENFDPSPLGHLFSSCWFSFVTGLASPFRNVMLPFVLEVHSEGNVEIPMKYPLPQHSWQSLPGNMTFSVDHSPIDRRKESESHDASAASTYLTLKKYHPGGWYTYPSEKYESQLGLLFPYNYDGKMKVMFQTTNQHE